MADKVTMQIIFDETHGRTNLAFSGKPSEEIRNEMKANGWRWSSLNKVWYPRVAEGSTEFAHALQEKYFAEQTTEKSSETNKFNMDFELEDVKKELHQMIKEYNESQGRKHYDSLGDMLLDSEPFQRILKEEGVLERDFNILSKEEYLKKYPFITKEEYASTLEQKYFAIFEKYANTHLTETEKVIVNNLEKQVVDINGNSISDEEIKSMTKQVELGLINGKYYIQQLGDDGYLTSEGQQEISAAEARDLLGEEMFIEGVERATFHDNSSRATFDGQHIYFDFSNDFDIVNSYELTDEDKRIIAEYHNNGGQNLFEYFGDVLGNEQTQEKEEAADKLENYDAIKEQSDELFNHRGWTIKLRDGTFWENTQNHVSVFGNSTDASTQILDTGIVGLPIECEYKIVSEIEDGQELFDHEFVCGLGNPYQIEKTKTGYKLGEMLVNESDIEKAFDLVCSYKNFDNALDAHKAGQLPDGYVFNLGKPGEILQKCGFPEHHNIELSASHMKFKMAKHDFSELDIKGLDKALQNPVAVFEYGDRTKSQNVIVELQKDGKNFLAGVHFNQKKDDKIEVSDIRGLFNRNNMDWLHWIEQGKMIYGDKEKIQVLASQQRSNFAEVAGTDARSSSDTYYLDSVDNILQEFGDVKQIFTDDFSDYKKYKERFEVYKAFDNYYRDYPFDRDLIHEQTNEFYDAWFSWIEQGKMIYGDKEKIQVLASQQRMTFADVAGTDARSSSDTYYLDSVDNILQEFGDVKQIFTDDFSDYKKYKERFEVYKAFDNYYRDYPFDRDLIHEQTNEFYDAWKKKDFETLNKYWVEENDLSETVRTFFMNNDKTIYSAMEFYNYAANGKIQEDVQAQKQAAVEESPKKYFGSQEVNMSEEKGREGLDQALQNLEEAVRHNEAQETKTLKAAGWKSVRRMEKRAAPNAANEKKAAYEKPNYERLNTEMLLAATHDGTAPFLPQENVNATVENGEVRMSAYPTVRSITSGKAYRGVNQLVTQTMFSQMDNKDSLVITYDQAKEAGTYIKKGSKSVPLTTRGKDGEIKVYHGFPSSAIGEDSKVIADLKEDFSNREAKKLLRNDGKPIECRESEPSKYLGAYLAASVSGREFHTSVETAKDFSRQFAEVLEKDLANRNNKGLFALMDSANEQCKEQLRSLVPERKQEQSQSLAVGKLAHEAVNEVEF